MEVLQDNVTYVVFDIQGVVVTSVRIGYNDYTDFHILTPNKNLGDELFFYLPTTYNKGDQLAVTIEYYTTEDQLATSWLQPGQTDGKKMSYLFTQCESIYCRSVAPMQDTPAVKSTYEASVIVP